MNNNFEHHLEYSEHDRNWSKSVDEFAKFFLDHLEKPDFLSFLKGLEVDSDKSLRWQERLDELFAKATKRIGHSLDREKLIREAYNSLCDQRESGELADSKIINLFCEEFKSK